MKKIATILIGTALALVLCILVGTQQEDIYANDHVINHLQLLNSKEKAITSPFRTYNQNSTKGTMEEVILNIDTNNEKIIKENESIEIEESMNLKSVAEENNVVQLTHDRIVELTDGFDQVIYMIMEEITDDYRIINYSSKDEIGKEYMPYAKEGVATPYIDQYFEEVDGALYGLPQDGPAWFEKEVDYTLESLSDTKILLTQLNENELHGKYTIKIEFENNNHQWKISNISVTSL